MKYVDPLKSCLEDDLAYMLSNHAVIHDGLPYAWNMQSMNQSIYQSINESIEQWIKKSIKNQSIIQ